MPQTKFQIYDRKNQLILPVFYDSEEDAEKGIEQRQLTPDDHEVIEVEVGDQPTEEERTAAEKAEEKRNYKIAQRTTTYDQNLVKEARTLGVNPDNFDSEEALAEGVERWKQDHPEAVEAADLQANASEDDSQESEEGEDERS